MVGKRDRCNMPVEVFRARVDNSYEQTLHAWEFLRTNPLTFRFFRPLSKMMHPCAIGWIESKELMAIAADIRELILRADEEMTPSARQREHDYNMKALTRFYQFCAAHRATNDVAITKYGYILADYFRELDDVDYASHLSRSPQLSESSWLGW